MKIFIKKYLSTPSIYLISFIFVILITWFYIHNNKNSSNENTHRWLQEQFQVVISDYIEKNDPQIQEIHFNKIYTKKTNNPLHVEIFFSYTLTIDDSSASGNTHLSGKALLTQKNDRTWVLSNFEVTNSILEFSEPIQIKGHIKKD